MAGDADQSASSDPSTRKRVARFDPTVNTGHILQIVVLALSVTTAWSSMDKRTALLERNAADTDSKMRETASGLKEALVDVKGEIKDLRQQIIELQWRVQASPVAAQRQQGG